MIVFTVHVLTSMRNNMVLRDLAEETLLVREIGSGVVFSCFLPVGGVLSFLFFSYLDFFLPFPSVSSILQSSVGDFFFYLLFF